jgi:ferredoxin
MVVLSQGESYGETLRLGYCRDDARSVQPEEIGSTDNPGWLHRHDFWRASSSISSTWIFWISSSRCGHCEAACPEGAITATYPGAGAAPGIAGEAITPAKIAALNDDAPLDQGL